MRALLVALLALGSAAHAQTTPEALLSAWTEAQNQGDFERYERLYARTFRGTRRTGGKVRSMDRSAWMEERARMFRAPLAVEATEVQIEGKRLRFVQTWSDGAWADRGSKVLEVVEEGGALRIAGETLMASKEIPVVLAPLEGDAQAIPGGLAVELDGTRLRLIDRRGGKAKSIAERELTTGAPIEALARHERALSDEAATLLPGYAAIAVRTKVFESEQGREWLDSEELTLFLWRGGKLSPVFSVLLHDDTSSPDCGKGSKATVEPGPAARGFPTLVVTAESSGENVAHCRAENGTKVTRYGWDGRRFVER
jgi:Domain of unknown function (DUF4440)